MLSWKMLPPDRILDKKRKCEEFDPKHQPEARQRNKRERIVELMLPVDPAPKSQAWSHALESAWTEYKARESGSDELATARAFDTWD